MFVKIKEIEMKKYSDLNLIFILMTNLLIIQKLLFISKEKYV